MLPDLEILLMLDRLLVAISHANVGKAISVNWNIGKISYQCITCSFCIFLSTFTCKYITKLASTNLVIYYF